MPLVMLHSHLRALPGGRPGLERIRIRIRIRICIRIRGRDRARGSSVLVSGAEQGAAPSRQLWWLVGALVSRILPVQPSPSL